MESSINFGSSQITFKYIENTSFYRFDKDQRHQEVTEYSFHSESDKSNNYLDLTSDSKKIFVNMPNSIYHFFIDYAGKILKQASLEKNLELIVADYNLNDSFFDRRIYIETLELFKSMGIKVIMVDVDKYDGIILNKIYVMPIYAVHQNYEKSLYEASLMLVDNKNVIPFRKVFLSRRHMGDRQHLSADLPVKHDNRIDSHHKIEDYFKNLGYEIVVPEHFRSLKEQVNFFYETKILISTTSSGLMNSAFMQEGQTMVELQTPLIVHMPRQDQMGKPMNGGFDFSSMVAVEQLHYFYIKMAFQKKHKYLALNNLTRESGKIISTIENDKYLKALLIGGEPEEVQQPRKRKWLRR
jgi:hypothetical protein